MVTSQEWFNSVYEAVSNSPNMVTTMKRDEMERMDITKFIEVEFIENTDTRKLFHEIPQKVEDHTWITLRPERETLQFKYEENAKRERFEGKELIRKILNEDIEVRENFEINYKMKEKSVVIESPVFRSIQLFDSLHTKVWLLTNVYEDEGSYKQTFEQFELSFEVDEPFNERYGRYRIENILWDISEPCSDCEGKVKLTPVSHNEDSKPNWIWGCTSCEKIYKYQNLDKLLERVSPLSDRAEIEQVFNSELAQIVKENR